MIQGNKRQKGQTNISYKEQIPLRRGKIFTPHGTFIREVYKEDIKEYKNIEIENDINTTVNKKNLLILNEIKAQEKQKDITILPANSNDIINISSNNIPSIDIKNNRNLLQKIHKEIKLKYSTISKEKSQKRLEEICEEYKLRLYKNKDLYYQQEQIQIQIYKDIDKQNNWQKMRIRKLCTATNDTITNNNTNLIKYIAGHEIEKACAIAQESNSIYQNRLCVQQPQIYNKCTRIIRKLQQSIRKELYHCDKNLDYTSYIMYSIQSGDTTWDTMNSIQNIIFTNYNKKNWGWLQYISLRFWYGNTPYDINRYTYERLCNLFNEYRKSPLCKYVIDRDYYSVLTLTILSFFFNIETDQILQWYTIFVGTKKKTIDELFIFWIIIDILYTCGYVNIDTQNSVTDMQNVLLEQDTITISTTDDTVLFPPKELLYIYINPRDKKYELLKYIIDNNILKLQTQVYSENRIYDEFTILSHIVPISTIFSQDLQCTYIKDTEATFVRATHIHSMHFCNVIDTFLETDCNIEPKIQIELRQNYLQNKQRKYKKSEKIIGNNTIYKIIPDIQRCYCSQGNIESAYRQFLGEKINISLASILILCSRWEELEHILVILYPWKDIDIDTINDSENFYTIYGSILYTFVDNRSSLFTALHGIIHKIPSILNTKYIQETFQTLYNQIYQQQDKYSIFLQEQNPTIITSIYIMLGLCRDIIEQVAA